ncbi:MAG: CRP-like cAMP-binding protein [Kiritimatiellia bacterium]|jgi:CRP-like cAMP-binding protein
MAWNWLVPKETITLASTQEELDAIFRFRYTVYVEERGFTFGGVDHEQRTVCDAEDYLPTARHVYAGTPEAIKGAGRLFVWDPQQVPQDWFDSYGMQAFPNIGDLRTCQLGRLAIGPGFRGKLILPSMISFMYEMMVRDEDVQLLFCDCRPSLMKYYRRLGCRPYGAKLMPYGNGLAICLVSVLSDYDYYRSVGAVSANQVRKHFGRGGRTPLDQTPFEHLFADDNLRIEAAADRVFEELEDKLNEPATDGSDWLGELPPRVLKKLAGSGFLLELDRGDVMVREGVAERELYVVMHGTAEVIRGDTCMAVVGAGSVIGEMAFFREAGVRTATVRALDSCRVLVIRYKFLLELKKSDPDAAFSIMFHLGQLLADRLDSTSAALGG